MRCAPPANKPTPEERDRCFPFLVRELDALVDVRTVVVLGRFAYDVVSKLYGLSGRPAFGHGVEVAAPAGGTAPSVICSYHPSQQNTFTGKLTEPMLDSVFERAAELSGLRARRSR